MYVVGLLCIFFQAFLGYTLIPEIDEKKRLRESAAAEIQLVLLWPDAKAFRSPVSESELERENENFSLDEVFEKGESRIFPH